MPSPARPRITRARVFVLLGLLAAVITIVLPILRWRRTALENYTASKCQRNLSQIAKGLLLYATDPANNGKNPSDLGALLLYGEMSPEVFICPMSDDEPAPGPTPRDFAEQIRMNPKHCSYIYIGAGLDFKDTHPETVILYDREMRHDGMNVLFHDGHAEWISKPQAEWILSELRAGHNPPRTQPATSPTR